MDDAAHTDFQQDVFERSRQTIMTPMKVFKANAFDTPRAEKDKQ